MLCCRPAGPLLDMVHPLGVEVRGAALDSRGPCPDAFSRSAPRGRTRPRPVTRIVLSGMLPHVVPLQTDSTPFAGGAVKVPLRHHLCELFHVGGVSATKLILCLGWGRPATRTPRIRPSVSLINLKELPRHFCPYRLDHLTDGRNPAPTRRTEIVGPALVPAHREDIVIARRPASHQMHPLNVFRSPVPLRSSSLSKPHRIPEPGLDLRQLVGHLLGDELAPTGRHRRR